MTILIIGYVITVAVAVYFMRNLQKDLTRVSKLNSNLKLWLDESNEALFKAGDDYRAACRVIDRYEEHLHKYGHWDNPAEGRPDQFADEVSHVIDDCVTHAGAYFDGDGMPNIDRMDWTPQDGVTYSEADDTDV